MTAVDAAREWLSGADIADPRINVIVKRLVPLAAHHKWEVRRAVANVAAHTRDAALDSALAKLVADDNGRVRQAALTAEQRRRDWASVSTLGEQHEEQIHATLHDIETRFGLRARAAVRRAAEQLTNTFAREFYHEVIKVVSPLATSADRLQRLLATPTALDPEALLQEARRIEARVARLQNVMEAMRTYAAQPNLTFGEERVTELLHEAVTLVRDRHSAVAPPADFVIEVDDGLVAEVARTRLIQALTNLLQNAAESYEGLVARNAIVVRATAEREHTTISIIDAGCGMSEENLEDAMLLFTTSKAQGTGFGLPLVKKIVETEHHGKLVLKSQVGQGTTASIVFPTRRRGREVLDD